ncbi:PASTA domain-containing protein [Patulibacter sp. NPDC049589]|uniref:PASTA domain-containing protein n=1 Tax=Patulibacter sp. NPDC049589 TaxID=3154731 RepID=UPI00343AC6C4
MRAPLLITTLVTLSLGAASATGCGTEDEGASATTVGERVTVQADAPAPDAVDGDASTGSGSSSDSGTADEESTATADTPRKAKARSSSSDCTEVPDVVGLKDLQLSQDTLRAAGFYVMDQEDTMGQGRSQLWDRNWVVTRQDPAGGECVSLDTTITTYAKKHGE